MNLKENKEYYYLKEQREVLVQLLSDTLISQEFFLTGGTALAVFYLHHRLSNDLDLFTCREMPLDSITTFVQRMWTSDAVKIRESRMFASFNISGTKVDFVVDPLSFDEMRQQITLEPGVSLQVDTLRNIRSNKLTAIVSRREPKDFIDFFMLVEGDRRDPWNSIYEDAKRKDAMFDDPPTVAFQLEETFKAILGGDLPFPDMRVPFDNMKFENFYNDLVRWIYNKGFEQGR